MSSNAYQKAYMRAYRARQKLEKPVAKTEVALFPGINRRDTRPVALRARDWTHLAINGYIRVLSSADAPHAAIVSAATALLDRGWGKPVESRVSMDLATFGEYSDDELRTMLNNLRAVRAAGKIIDHAPADEAGPGEPAVMDETPGVQAGETPPADPAAPRTNGKG